MGRANFHPRGKKPALRWYVPAALATAAIAATAIGVLSSSGRPNKPESVVRVPKYVQPAEPPWEYPAPLGNGEATNAMTSVAAPLLGGFSLTLIGVVAQAPESFRWPGLALAILTLTVALFVACIQLGFHARANMYSKAEIEAWGWSKFTRESTIQFTQRAHFNRGLVTQKRARYAYNLAIIFLAVAVAVAIVPPGHYGAADHPVALNNIEFALRWVAAGIAASAAVAELVWWIAVSGAAARRKRSVKRS